MSLHVELIPRCETEHCITCSDEGVAMRVVTTDEDRGLALCEDAGGSRSTVEIALVAPVETGDSLLVHAGVALVALEAAESSA